MYVTNGTYRSEMTRSARRPTKITGSIEIDRFADEFFTFENKDIVEKSLKIDNSIEGENHILRFGSVYMGRCVLSLKSGKLNGEDVELTKELQKTLQGKKMTINLTQYYVEKKLEDYTDDDPHDTIPLGVWKISAIDNVGMNKMFNITAYDGIDALDEPFGYQSITNKKISEIMAEAAVLLQYQMSDAEKSAIDQLSPTDAYTGQLVRLSFSWPEDSDKIPTWRVLVSQLCSIMGCFAYINREGRLKVQKAFTNWTNWGNAVLSNKMIKGLKYDEVHNAYNKVTAKIKGLDYEREATIPDDYEFKDTTTFYEINLGEYSYNFGEGLYAILTNRTIINNRLNEIKSFGGSSTMKRLNYLRTASGEVEYILGDPTLELGDVIRIETTDGSVTAANKQYIDFIITSYSWTYHGGHKLKSIGLERGTMLEASKTQQTQQNAKVVSTIYDRIMPLVGTNAQAINISNTNSINLVRIDGIPQKRGTVLLTGQTTVYTTKENAYVRLYATDGTTRQMLGNFICSNIGQNTLSFSTYINYLLSDAPESLTLQIETNGFNTGSPAIVDANDAKFIIMPYWR